MEKGETGNTAEKCRDNGTCIEAVRIRSPRLQRAAGHVQCLGRLTLRETLRLESAILRKQVCAFEAMPALVAILVVLLRLLHYCAHSDLLFHPVPWYRDS